MNITTSIKLAASQAKAWEVLAEQFGEIATWTTALRSSTLEGPVQKGAVRICESAPFGPFPASVVKERLVEYDPQNFRFAYVAYSGLPAMFKHAQNNWSIERIDESNCWVHSHAVIKISWWLKPISWLLKALIKRDVKKVVIEIQHYIETGTIHPRKAASITEQATT